MRQVISVVFCVGTIILVCLTLISFSDYQSQTFDIFDHLRLHYIICAGFAFFIFIWLRKTHWIALVLLVLFSNGYILYSSSLLTLAETKVRQGTKVIKLLNFNAYFRNNNSKAFLSYVNQEQPDLIVLEEFFEIRKDVIRSLKSQYKYSGPVFIKSENATTKIPNYIFIFSKFPFELKTFKHWNIGVRNPPIAHVEVKLGQAKIDLMAVHMPWPYNAKLKAQGLEWLSEYLETLTNPVLLVGDFNLTPWSDALLKFTSENKLKKFGKFERSWPSQTADIYVPFAHFLIDHVFVRNSDKWKFHKHKFSAGPSIGSDHLPMMSKFSISRK